MSKDATGTVEYRKRKDGSGKWWGRVTCVDGSRPWIELAGNWPNSPQGRLRAQEAAASHSETMRARGIVAVPARYRGDRRPDDATMAAWLDAWIKSRELRGMTSTRENRSHYEQ